MKNSTLIGGILVILGYLGLFILFPVTTIIISSAFFVAYVMSSCIDSDGSEVLIKNKFNIYLIIKKLLNTFAKYVDSKEPIIKPKSKSFNHKFECYEIHTVQARMFGCNTQCDKCKKQERAGKLNLNK